MKRKLTKNKRNIKGVHIIPKENYRVLNRKLFYFTEKYFYNLGQFSREISGIIKGKTVTTRMLLFSSLENSPSLRFYSKYFNEGDNNE